MKHGLKMALAAGALVLISAAPNAEAATAQTLAPLNLEHQSQVEQTHWRRWRHCHTVRRCWIGKWGYRRCHVVRHCGRRW